MAATIRKATKKDFKTVSELFSRLHAHEHDNFGKMLNLKWPTNKSGQRFIRKHFENPKHAVFVAELDNQVVGYVFGGKVPIHSAWTRVRLYSLANIYVAEECRGDGIGSQLMNEFIAWAKQQGAERIKLGVFSKNKTAMRLYKKHGFESVVSTMMLDV